MLHLRLSKTIVTVCLLVLIILVMSCGEEATATPTPDTTSQDIAATVQQAIAAAMPAAGAGGAQQMPSETDIAQLVQAAVQAASSEGASPQEIEAMVKAAVEAAARPGVTPEELNAVVSGAVQSAIQAQATPMAMVTETPAPVVMMEPSGTLNVGFPDIGTPLFSLRQQAFQAQRADLHTTHETAFATAADGQVIPRLVRDWTVDDSGLVYTMHLQEGAMWHTNFGEWGNFDADDFLFSVGEVASEGAPHPVTSHTRRIFLCGECKLTKIDDYTVQLERPSPTFEITWHSRAPESGAISFHSKKHFNGVGEDAAILQAVGTGPWEMYDVKSSEFRKMRAVRDHWRNTPAWEEMIWWTVFEDSTRLANFLTGLLDTALFTLDTIQDIKAENVPGIKYMSFPGGVMNNADLLGMHHFPEHPAHHPSADGKPAQVPLADNHFDCTLPWVSCDRDITSEEWATARKVRLALALAVDRQKLVNAIAFGEGRPFHIMYWNSFDTRVEQFGLNEVKFDYDPERAKELLTEAGYPDGFKIDVTLTGSTGEPVAQAVATMWENIGITTVQSRMPYSAFRPSLVSREAKGMWIHSTGPPSVEPLKRYTILQNAANSINFGWEHPDWQALLDEMTQLTDVEERWAKQAEGARWIIDEVMVIPLFGQNVVWPVGPNIDAWEPMGGRKDWLSNWDYVPHRQ
jgi:ABC-type transport system substrate-binding protein